MITIPTTIIPIKQVVKNEGDLVAVPGFSGYYCTAGGDVYSARKGHPVSIGHSKDKDGYLKVMLVGEDGRPNHMRKHRVIALTFLGDSELMINHKNGIRDDNRIENLEYVTERENQSHWRIKKGYDIGVCWARKERKWRAYIQEGHKWEHLGFYENKADAKAAYLNKLNEYKLQNKYAERID